MGSLRQAVSDVELIVESVPERIEAKRATYGEIEAHASPDALITSSTSGLLPSELQAEMHHPGRFLVAHPFNPVYLVPLVEVVAGRRTAPATTSTRGTR